MATQTITPNGVATDNAAWTIGGGAATKHDAISDNSDATWIQANIVQGSNQVPIVFDFSTFTLPTNAVVTTHHILLRGKLTTTGNADAVSTFYFPGQPTPSYGTAGLILGGNTIQTWDGGNYILAITQAQLDVLQALVSITFHTAATATIYNLSLQINYNEMPVVVVTGPTEGSSITNTTRPTVTWTYADPEGDAQYQYRVKIFSAAQYGAGGFNPETSTATWDSGEVLGADVSVTIPIDLVNSTTYRAYVKATDGVKFNDTGLTRWSTWDSNTFTINVTAPPAPTLVLTGQPANANGPRTKIDITRAVSATPTTYMTIDCSDDGGTTWKSMQISGTHIFPSDVSTQIVNSPDGTTFTYYDYTAIPGVQRSYRTKAVRTV